MQLKQCFAKLGVPVLVDSPTNQQFPILPNAVLNMLKQAYSYETIQVVDAGHTAVRFCTSWATRTEDVRSLIGQLEQLMK